MDCLLSPDRASAQRPVIPKVPRDAPRVGGPAVSRTAAPIHRPPTILGIAAVVAVATALAANAMTVAHYRFEEGAGSNLVDAVDGSIDGTHSALYDPNVFADHLPLTGDPNQYALWLNWGMSAVAEAQPFIFHSGFGDATLEFFVNFYNQDHHSLFWTRGDETDANRFNISVNPGGRFALDYREPDGSIHPILPESTSAVFLPLDTWVHVAVVRDVQPDLSHRYRFYVDGVLADTGFDPVPNLPTSAEWKISGRGNFYYYGLVDEVRFSDAALAPDQFLTAPEPAGSMLLAPAALALFGRRRRL